MLCLSFACAKPGAVDRLQVRARHGAMSSLAVVIESIPKAAARDVDIQAG
jgi:hypothetical protein